MACLPVLEILEVTKRAPRMMPRDLSILLCHRRRNFISYQILYLGSKVMRVGFMLWLVILLRSYLGLTKLPFIDNCMKILFLDLIMNEFVLIVICTVDGFQSISVEDKFFMVFVYH